MKIKGIEITTKFIDRMSMDYFCTEVAGNNVTLCPVSSGVEEAEKRLQEYGFFEEAHKDVDSSESTRVITKYAIQDGWYAIAGTIDGVFTSPVTDLQQGKVAEDEPQARLYPNDFIDVFFRPVKVITGDVQDLDPDSKMTRFGDYSQVWELRAEPDYSKRKQEFYE